MPLIGEVLKKLLFGHLLNKYFKEGILHHITAFIIIIVFYILHDLT